MINSGKYNHKITIYREIKTKDADGFDSTVPENVLITYAEVKTTKGFTLIANDSDFEKAFTRFVFRYPITKINRKMFVAFNEKKYSIEYINNLDEAGIEMELQCKEIEH
jgi:SPP1 family predicted phage head-tail adaptor